jgi:Tol biopolymer transport system component
VAFYQDDVGGLEDHGIKTVGLNGKGESDPFGPTCAEGKGLPCPRHPRWSPGGDRIAFALGGRIAVMNADGSNVTVLSLPGVASANRPAWSPDAQRLVFEGIAAGQRNVYAARLDGGGLEKLTSGGGAQPAWSSSNRIAFARSGRIYSMGPNGSGPKPLARGSQPNWSPHSGQLVFVRKRNVLRLNLRTGRVIKVSHGNNPVWTPDGRQIVFDRGDAGFRAIYRVRLGAGRAKFVTGGLEGRVVQVLEPDVQPR